MAIGIEHRGIAEAAVVLTRMLSTFSLVKKVSPVMVMSNHGMPGDFSKGHSRPVAGASDLYHDNGNTTRMGPILARSTSR
jgi:hypothetical protein